MTTGCLPFLMLFFGCPLYNIFGQCYNKHNYNLSEEMQMAKVFYALLAQLLKKNTRTTYIPAHASAESRRADVQKPMREMERKPVSVENITDNVADNKEDFLLSQIDEFREKAKQLQDLLATKESKAKELQSLVSEREDKAQQLEQILCERQEEADLIMKDFNKKVDELSDRVTNKMADIEQSISNQILEVKKTSMEQLDENRKLNEEQLAANKRLSEEQLAASRQFLEEQAIANKKISDDQIEEVKQILDNTTTQLDSIKTDLSEKVHSENVKCYRNIQDLFNEFDARIEKMDEMEKSVGSIRGYVKCLTWFSVINFVLLIALILFSLGVFG